MTVMGTNRSSGWGFMDYCSMVTDDQNVLVLDWYNPRNKKCLLSCRREGLFHTKFRLAQGNSLGNEYRWCVVCLMHQILNLVPLKQDYSVTGTFSSHQYEHFQTYGSEFNWIQGEFNIFLIEIVYLQLQLLPHQAFIFNIYIYYIYNYKYIIYMYIYRLYIYYIIYTCYYK